MSVASGAEAGVSRAWRPKLVSVRSLVTLGITLALLIFLATGFVPDLGAVRRRIGDSDVVLLVLALAVHYASLLPRGYRWRVLLLNARPDGVAREKVPSGSVCGLYLLLCWLVNAVTWLRVGNVYRAYLVSQRTEGDLSWVLATVVVERLLDLVAILLMLAAAGLLLLSTEAGAPVGPFLLTALGAIAALCGAFSVLRRFDRPIVRLIPERLRPAYLRFEAAALTSVRRRDLPVLGALTLLGWAMETLRLLLVVEALGLQISVKLLLFVTFAQALLVSVPVTPGGLGLVEPGLTGVLLFAFARPDAVSIALLDRVVSLLSVVVIGGVVFAVREVALRRGAVSTKPSVRMKT